MKSMKTINSNLIYDSLKKNVFGQDEYLRKLAILGYRHQLNIMAHTLGIETVCNGILGLLTGKTALD